MTVEQLIAILQKMPQDAEAFVSIIYPGGQKHVQSATCVRNLGLMVIIKHEGGEKS